MTIPTVGTYVLRNDTGARVYVREVEQCGLRVFVVTEDAKDGHTAILETTQLRPVPAGQETRS